MDTPPKAIARTVGAALVGRTLRIAITALMMCALPAAAQTCQEIRFQPGAYHGDVYGEAPGAGEVCYTIGLRPGQYVRIEMFDGANTRFSVDGLAGVHTGLGFDAFSDRHTIRLRQQTRGPLPDPFAFRVTVQ